MVRLQVHVISTLILLFTLGSVIGLVPVATDDSSTELAADAIIGCARLQRSARPERLRRSDALAPPGQDPG
jgi:hypothetical protein